MGDPSADSAPGSRRACDGILGRRSVRRFERRPVDDALVRSLLEAAMAAPSAGDQRPWHFVVVTAAGTLAALSRSHPYAKPLAGAPLAVVVCGDETVTKWPPFWPQDCAAATQNLLLAAHELGLGAVWIGVYPLEERVAAVRTELGVPEGVVPFAMVALGHPATQREPVERYDAARVHRERW
ncbi:MAG: nitroreductase family protein [Thermoleophilia bacterium]|nr:nitroreductase family protein [Thermoleophilia bacterium]